MSEVEVASRLAKVVHIKTLDYVGGALEIVINRGSQQGIASGQRFLVFGIGPHITDPDSGRDLGASELVSGQGVVVHVQEHLATLKALERRRSRPAKRVIREPDGSVLGFGLRAQGIFGSSGNIIEEQLSPEEEVPFDTVQLGDYAKPI